MRDKGGFRVHGPCLCPSVSAVASAFLGQALEGFINPLNSTSLGPEP